MSPRPSKIFSRCQKKLGKAFWKAKFSCMRLSADSTNFANFDGTVKHSAFYNFSFTQTHLCPAIRSSPLVLSGTSWRKLIPSSFDFMTVSLMFFIVICFSDLSAQERVWTESKTGKTIKAEFIQMEENLVTLKLSNGNLVEVDEDRLSQGDVDYINNRIKQIKNNGDGGLFGIVQVPESESVMREILPRKDNVWKYRTRHFVIESYQPLSENAQKNVGKVFEVTWKSLRVVPITTRVTRLDSTFKVTLFLNYEQYKDRGGDSEFELGNGRIPGAWYSPGEDVTYVSYERIGLDANGDFKTKNQQDLSVITHEITHHLTEGFYNPNFTWICEGLACYFQHIPYDGKQLDFGMALAKIPSIMHEDVKVNTSFKDFLHYDYNDFHDSKDESAHYDASHLLVAFFIHLDGKDGASRFARYLAKSEKKSSDDPRKDRDGYAIGFNELLQGRDIDELENSFVEAWEKRGVTVTFAEFSGK